MKKQLLTLALIIGASSAINAQEEQTKKEQTKKEELKNVRSSLHIMIIESDNFPQKEVVLKAFNNAPFPDKYNDHQIGEKSFNPIDYPLTAEEKAIIYTPSKMGKLAEGAGVKIDSLKKELPYRINKYLAKEKIANKLVAKWFNIQADGSFDYNSIGELGSMSASAIDIAIAENANNGMALLKTAGLELIGKTFVVINKLNFYANEPVVRVIRDAAKKEIETSMVGSPQALIDKALKAIDKAYEIGKEGYSIFATSFLYKLVWNDTISTAFYGDFEDPNKKYPEKIAAFYNSDLYKLEFVGDESASSLVTFSLNDKRTEAQTIELATVRITDKTYAKLQQKYDVFKTRVALLSGIPITAKIGTKEGLVGGEKFEVLQPSQVSRVSPVIYKRIGTIKVDKDLIWDNTYNAGEAKDLDPVADGVAPKPVINATTFKGGNKYEEGYYIKQIK